MKKSNRVYWLLSGLFSAILLFSAYYTGSEVEGFRRLGFPDYFRIELMIGKIIGAILLLIPQVPQRLREWIYAAFGINLISAFIAKLNSGYSLVEVLIDPGLTFVTVIVLIIFLDKHKKPGLNFADGQ
jgi:hypothetical protein